MASPVEGDEGDQPASLRPAVDDFAPQPLPVGSDGKIPEELAVAPAAALPPATPENFICMRGPCRQFVHMKSHFDAGNPEGTFDNADGGLVDESGQAVKAPKQHTYFCLAVPPYIQLNDEQIEDCSRWNPELPDDPDVLLRDVRRRRFYDENKHLAPAEDGELEALLPPVGEEQTDG